MWKFDEQNNLNSFGIKYQNKVKWFQAETSYLWKLKKILGGKIFQGNISLFYTSIQEIGSGASCKVFKVKENKNQEQFASKCIRKDYIFQRKNDTDRLNRMNQEIQMLASFEHPNIILLHEIYEGDNSFYIIQEFFDGVTLQSFLKKFNCDLKMIKDIMKQILMALSYLRKKQIIHRDLKPDNVMISVDDQNQVKIKVIDFGLASYETSDLQVCGTPGYIAPEVFQVDEQKKSSYDNKADVFSAGAIFYKLLTKRSLYSGRTSEEVLSRNRKSIIDFEPLFAQQLHPKTVHLVQQMLQLNPKKRPTAEEALENEFFLDSDQQKKNSLKSNEDLKSNSSSKSDFVDFDLEVDDEQPSVSVPLYPTVKQLMGKLKESNSQYLSQYNHSYYLHSNGDLGSFKLIDGNINYMEINASYHPSFGAGHASLESMSYSNQQQTQKILLFAESDHIIEYDQLNSEKSKNLLYEVRENSPKILLNTVEQLQK